MWSVISTLAVFPHELSYFNEFAGGPLQGHHHLPDANIDWGQDLLALKRWDDSRSDPLPLQAACAGLLGSSVYGLRLTMSQPRTDVFPRWCVTSINHLFQYEYPDDDEGNYRLLRQEEPAMRIGYSIHVYLVSRD